MDEQQLLERLLELAEGEGIEVRLTPSAGSDEHPGGACVRLKGREVLFLNPHASPPERVAVVAGALRGRAALGNRFLPPEVREAIDPDV